MYCDPRESAVIGSHGELFVSALEIPGAADESVLPFGWGRLGEELEASLCYKVWTVHDDFLGGAACGVHVARTEVVYGADLVRLDDSESGGDHRLRVWGWLDRLQANPAVGDFFLGGLP